MSLKNFDQQRTSSPLYQFSASEGEGASKYKMALLSTKRNAGKHGYHQPRLLMILSSNIYLPLPCTILAGCGRVCILNTAHKSTCEPRSWPSDGSRHKTRRSLHSIPINGRGVNSGAKQSTCTVVASPCELIVSNDTTAFRTTRVSKRGPSMMRRLKISYWTVSGTVKKTHRKNIPMRLDQGAREFTPDS
jgi:hypothetical protein